MKSNSKSPFIIHKPTTNWDEDVRFYDQKSLKKQIKELKNQIDIEITQKKILEKKLFESENFNEMSENSFQLEMKKNNEDIDDLEDRIRTYEIDKAEMAVKIAEQHFELENLRIENQKFYDEIMNLKSELKNYKKIYEEQQKDIKKWEIHLEQIMVNINEKDEFNFELKKEVGGLNMKLDEERKKTEKMTKEYLMVKSDIFRASVKSYKKSATLILSNLLISALNRHKAAAFYKTRQKSLKDKWDFEILRIFQKNKEMTLLKKIFRKWQLEHKDDINSKDKRLWISEKRLRCVSLLNKILQKNRGLHINKRFLIWKFRVSHRKILINRLNIIFDKINLKNDVHKWAKFTKEITNQENHCKWINNFEARYKKKSSISSIKFSNIINKYKSQLFGSVINKLAKNQLKTRFLTLKNIWSTNHKKSTIIMKFLSRRISKIRHDYIKIWKDHCLYLKNVFKIKKLTEDNVGLLFTNVLVRWSNKVLSQRLKKQREESDKNILKLDSNEKSIIALVDLSKNTQIKLLDKILFSKLHSYFHKAINYSKFQSHINHILLKLLTRQTIKQKQSYLIQWRNKAYDLEITYLCEQHEIQRMDKEDLHNHLTCLENDLGKLKQEKYKAMIRKAEKIDRMLRRAILRSCFLGFKSKIQIWDRIETGLYGISKIEIRIGKRLVIEMIKEISRKIKTKSQNNKRMISFVTKSTRQIMSNFIFILRSHSLTSKRIQKALIRLIHKKNKNLKQITVRLWKRLIFNQKFTVNEEMLKKSRVEQDSSSQKLLQALNIIQDSEEINQFFETSLNRKSLNSLHKITQKNAEIRTRKSFEKWNLLINLQKNLQQRLKKIVIMRKNKVLRLFLYKLNTNIISKSYYEYRELISNEKKHSKLMKIAKIYDKYNMKMSFKRYKQKVKTTIQTYEILSKFSDTLSSFNKIKGLKKLIFVTKQIKSRLKRTELAKTFRNRLQRNRLCLILRSWKQIKTLKNESKTKFTDFLKRKIKMKIYSGLIRWKKSIDKQSLVEARSRYLLLLSELEISNATQNEITDKLTQSERKAENSSKSFIKSSVFNAEKLLNRFILNTKRSTFETLKINFNFHRSRYSSLVQITKIRVKKRLKSSFLTWTTFLKQTLKLEDSLILQSSVKKSKKYRKRLHTSKEDIQDLKQVYNDYQIKAKIKAKSSAEAKRNIILLRHRSEIFKAWHSLHMEKRNFILSLTGIRVKILYRLVLNKFKKNTVVSLKLQCRNVEILYGYEIKKTQERNAILLKLLKKQRISDINIHEFVSYHEMTHIRKSLSPNKKLRKIPQNVSKLVENSCRKIYARLINQEMVACFNSWKNVSNNYMRKYEKFDRQELLKSIKGLEKQIELKMAEKCMILSTASVNLPLSNTILPNKNIAFYLISRLFKTKIANYFGHWSNISINLRFQEIIGILNEKEKEIHCVKRKCVYLEANKNKKKAEHEKSHIEITELKIEKDKQLKQLSERDIAIRKLLKENSNLAIRLSKAQIEAEHLMQLAEESFMNSEKDIVFK